MKFIKELWNSIKILEKLRFIRHPKKKQKFFFTLLVSLLIVIIILLLLLLVIKFQSIAGFFFKGQDPNGELLKVLLTIFGGFGLFYGLFINSRRIQEQTRQNNISEYSNSDKRFTDAIGYLGSNNNTISLGGIFSLYQLAKEDVRYKAVVAGIFTSFIQDKSIDLYNELENHPFPDTQFTKTYNTPILIRTIISLLFNSDNIFKGLKLDLSRTLLKNLNFLTDVENCDFSHCEIVNCYFLKNVKNCSFGVCKVSDCTFGSKKSIIDNCDFFATLFIKSRINGITLSNTRFRNACFNNSILQLSNINYCKFEKSTFEEKVEFIEVKSFIGIKLNSKYKDVISFQNCENHKQIFESSYYAPSGDIVYRST